MSVAATPEPSENGVPAATPAVEAATIVAPVEILHGNADLAIEAPSPAEAGIDAPGTVATTTADEAPAIEAAAVSATSASLFDLVAPQPESPADEAAEAVASVDDTMDGPRGTSGSQGA